MKVGGMGGGPTPGGRPERGRALATWLVILLGLAACEDGLPTDGGNGSGNGRGGGSETLVEVRLSDALAFVEDMVAVELEGTVRWVSDSNHEHTVTPTEHSQFESAKAVQWGQVVLEHVFTEVGVFEYHCEFHRELGMTGTVVVQAP